MKILIIAGGTGSIQLQQGIYSMFGHLGELDVKVLVNAYDNGLSTGMVRKVCHGQILGPSDVRKNQTTLHELKYGQSNLLKFLNIRFTCNTDEVKEYAYNELDKLHREVADINYPILRTGLDSYFAQSLSHQIDYNDFSLSNMIYAGLAARYGNSLSTAAALMADVLCIPNNVILNDDMSLYLKAVAEDGTIIHDEGDIVNWQNPNNPIVNTFFEDVYGNKKIPVLSNDAKKIIQDADIIICSSGTQWSSLIPTYQSEGFREAYTQSRAAKYLVMNKSQDKDMIGKSATDICNIVSRYMSLADTTVVVDTSAEFEMSNIYEHEVAIGRIIRQDFSSELTPDKKKHSPTKLVSAIFRDLFKINNLPINTTFVFDYDDTLVGRGNTYPEASAVNISLLFTPKLSKSIIVTGNSIKSIGLRLQKQHNFTKSISVYADGGINQYTIAPSKNTDIQTSHFEKCIAPAFLFDDAEVVEVSNQIKAIGINAAKIENRHNATLSIKPIDTEYRTAIQLLLQHLLRNKYKIEKTGRTTIDITKPGCDKSLAAKDIFANAPSSIFYVGDEIENGNDAAFVEFAKQQDKFAGCLCVANPQDTAMLLTLLTSGDMHE